MSRPVTRGTYHRSCTECGWANAYATERVADYALSRHRCSTHLARVARAERVQARIDRDDPPKPCPHKDTEHVHGTHACYVLDACRCKRCRDANRVYEENRRRLHAYGRFNSLIDAEPARAHVRHLTEQGMGLKQIVKASGISSGSMTKLMYGLNATNGRPARPPAKRIRPDTAARILAVNLTLADGAQIDGTGTRRRLRALVAIGYSIASLGAALGTDNIHRTIHHHGKVLHSTATATRALYDQLSMTPCLGTDWHSKSAATRARNYAAANGWLPPLEWDDDLIDDPTHIPTPAHATATRCHDQNLDEIAIYRRMHGDKTIRLSKAEKDELVRRRSAAGRPLAECERVTGVNAHRHLVDRKAAS